VGLSGAFHQSVRNFLSEFSSPLPRYFSPLPDIFSQFRFAFLPPGIKPLTSFCSKFGKLTICLPPLSTCIPPVCKRSHFLMEADGSLPRCRVHGSASGGMRTMLGTGPVCGTPASRARRHSATRIRLRYCDWWTTSSIWMILSLAARQQVRNLSVEERSIH
jgi:hypothetical protein